MAKKPISESQAGPLAGIQVLDFGTYLAGSYNAVIMGDLGAEVIKVESLAGDGARGVGPFYGDESRAFMGWNRNKRGLAVNVREKEGLAIVYELVRRSDVVTTNFRTGVAERLKLDYESLRELNPRLIYNASTGFGPVGPMSRRPAFDAIFQTMGGVAMGNVRTMGKIGIAAPVFVDIHTAMLALTGVLAALFHRERTGEGQKVETSLLQGVMSVQPSSYTLPLEMEPERALGAVPYRLFETREGQIFIAITQSKHWERFCRGIGHPELSEDPLYRTNADRTDRSDELYAILEPIMASKTAPQWDAILTEHEVPCGIALSHDEFFAHPQVEAMGMKTVIEHSTVGPIQVYGVPIGFEKTPGQIRSAAPVLGEHTRQILGEIGYDEERIEELGREGLVILGDKKVAPRA